MRTIAASELFELCQRGEGVELIDVRTPAEFQAVHATPARNEPLERLQPKQVMAGRNGQADRPLYVICRTGGRAEMACQKFITAGYENVVLVSGGTQAWEAAGLPVARGRRKVLPLDRQMRIVAGALVLIGVLLSLLHPAFIALSAFVGGGLIFAGITNICPMMSLLALMPWNQGLSCETPA